LSSVTFTAPEGRKLSAATFALNIDMSVCVSGGRDAADEAGRAGIGAGTGAAIVVDTVAGAVAGTGPVAGTGAGTVEGTGAGTVFACVEPSTAAS